MTFLFLFSIYSDNIPLQMKILNMVILILQVMYFLTDKNNLGTGLPHYNPIFGVHSKRPCYM